MALPRTTAALLLGTSSRLANGIKTALRPQMKKHLAGAIDAFQPIVIIALIGVEGVGGPPRGVVVRRLPVDPLHGSIDGRGQRLHLRALFPPPSGKAGLSDPQLPIGAQRCQMVSDGIYLMIPAMPGEFGCAREAVDADGIDILENTASVHQLQPLEIQRPRSGQY